MGMKNLKRAFTILALPAAVMTIAACGTPAAVSSTPQPTATTSSTPGASLACRLPVAQSDPGQTAVGFIALPSGSFQADTRPGIVYDASRQGNRTTQTPVLYGDSGGSSYDAAAGRWLPVPPAQVLPDGSAYVYTRERSPNQFLNEIHRVQVATGADRIIYNQGAYDALAYRPDGVYLVHHLSGTDANNGLWRLDPASGTLTAFAAATRGSWAAIAGGGAWSYSLDGNRFGSGSLGRLDLATDRVAIWQAVASNPQGAPDGPGVHVIAFDPADHPVVETYASGATPEVSVISNPGVSRKLSGIALGLSIPQLGVTDAHGAWIVGADGVYLYTDAGFQRMAITPTGWSRYLLAGICR